VADVAVAANVAMSATNLANARKALPARNATQKTPVKVPALKA
jgi:hypothetical protein